MQNNEDKLLVRIAEMYYKEGKNQNQISKELAIHRSTISRLLKRSRDEEIVTISINYDKAGTYTLEKQLQEVFSLKKVIIVQTASEQSRKEKNRSLIKGLDPYLHEIVTDDIIIGFSWGETLAELPNGLSDYFLSDVLCVPMIGGPSGRLSSEYHVNTITYEASKKLNARALLIDAPAFPETIALKKALMENKFNQTLIEFWRKLDIAILGIGSPLLNDSESWKQFYGSEISTDMHTKKAVGDVVSRFYDANGQPIDNKLDDRLIGINVSDLKRVPYRIGIAESKDKALSIVAALKGEYINVLVTTEETAIEMLRYTTEQNTNGNET